MQGTARTTSRSDKRFKSPHNCSLELRAIAAFPPGAPPRLHRPLHVQVLLARALGRSVHDVPPLRGWEAGGQEGRAQGSSERNQPRAVHLSRPEEAGGGGGSRRTIVMKFSCTAGMLKRYTAPTGAAAREGALRSGGIAPVSTCVLGGATSLPASRSSVSRCSTHRPAHRPHDRRTDEIQQELEALQAGAAHGGWGPRGRVATEGGGADDTPSEKTRPNTHAPLRDAVDD